MTMMATVSRLMKTIVMYVNKPPPNNDTAATITLNRFIWLEVLDNLLKTTITKLIRF